MGFLSGDGGLGGSIIGGLINPVKSVEEIINLIQGEQSEEKQAAARKKKRDDEREAEEKKKKATILATRQQAQQQRRRAVSNIADPAATVPGTSVPGGQVGRIGGLDINTAARLAGNIGDARIEANRQKELAKQSSRAVGVPVPKAERAPARGVAPPALGVTPTRQLRDIVKFARIARANLDRQRSLQFQQQGTVSPFLQQIRQRRGLNV